MPKLQSLTMLSVIYGANNIKNRALISSKPVALKVFILQRYLNEKHNMEFCKTSPVSYFCPQNLMTSHSL